MFFPLTKFSSEEILFPHPIYRGPLRISALLPTEPEKNPHRKRILRVVSYDLQYPWMTQNEYLDPTIQPPQFQLRKK